MNNKFIGKSSKTGKIIMADNKLYDRTTDSYYLIPNVFELDILPVGSKHSLHKYKIADNSLGEAVATDIKGQTIYTGDKVKIEYYQIDAPVKSRLTTKATVVYDQERKIFYMRTTDNKAFLFAGDTQHYISNITRIGR